MFGCEFEVIDAHCHPIPLDNQGVHGRYGFPTTAAEFVAEMHRCGVSRWCGSVIQRIDGTNFAEVQKFNAAALDLRDHYMEYTPGVHIHPNFPQESVAELEKLYAQGVRWVGELTAYMMGYSDYNTPGLAPALDFMQSHQMILNIHEGNASKVSLLARNFPQLTIVCAHPGDGNTVSERIEMLNSSPNIHLDISGTGLFRWGLLRHLIDKCGVEKLLFGTDFPICSIPMQIGGVLGEPLSDTEKALILAGNFKRLLTAAG